MLAAATSITLQLDLVWKPRQPALYSFKLFTSATIDLTLLSLSCLLTDLHVLCR